MIYESFAYKGSNVDSKISDHFPSGDTPQERYDLKLLHAIRKIIRASDMHSKELAAQHNITTPQLVTLHTILLYEKTTINALSKMVSLDASTLVGIIDRLESKGYVKRERSVQDRRQVAIQITEAGRMFIDRAPSPLQSSLDKALQDMPAQQQAAMVEMLEQIARLMDTKETPLQ